jgi:hypothetical protein
VVRVIPEIDIWHAANLMLKRYGEVQISHSTALASDDLHEVLDTVVARLNALGEANCTRAPCSRRGYSKEKMRFQSFFMLITVQSRAFASSISETENVPTLVSGRSPAGP